jgi:hypothetical protein
MNKKGAKIKTKTNKQDYTVGTVSIFIKKIIETGNTTQSEQIQDMYHHISHAGSTIVKQKNKQHNTV